MVVLQGAQRGTVYSSHSIHGTARGSPMYSCPSYRTALLSALVAEGQSAFVVEGKSAAVVEEQSCQDGSVSLEQL